MTNETDSKVAGQLLTDEILCPCDNITYEAFRKAIWARPTASFDAVCEDSMVGQKCTSCLLNAESIFSEATTTRPDVTDDVPRSRRRLTLSKQDIYAVIDRLSPKLPFVRESIVPIVAGRGARTVVSVSNATIKAIGARSPDFRIEAEMRDVAGAVFASQEGRVTAGARIDLEASAKLPGAEGERFVTGSCRVRFEPCSPGYFGTIRPHFAVITPLAMTAVHGQGRGRTSSVFTTMQGPATESQFLSAVNCANEPGELAVEQFDGTRLIDRQTLDLPARGACLVPLGSASEVTTATARPLTVRSSSDVETRFHIMVSCGDPPRISLDHI
ncbi:MAG: hypothetical protein QGF53_11015 [Alphaproteobacteria bacterium]|jgi:bacterioferritin-associated ferredoxin|nr:hypothetical protein [Alphaproteobacteria bacterium]